MALRSLKRSFIADSTSVVAPRLEGMPRHEARLYIALGRHECLEAPRAIWAIILAKRHSPAAHYSGRSRTALSALAITFEHGNRRLVSLESRSLAGG